LGDLRIFVVDNNELTRRMMERILHAFGCTQICQASDGAEALKTARVSFRPDVIITDRDMAPMNGFVFTSMLRGGQSFSSDVPAVMVSALTGEDAVQSAFDAGVDEYLPKSVDAAALYNVLTRIIGKAGPEQASRVRYSAAHL
jgi:two-component system chemotaxis response regulator CheY